MNNNKISFVQAIITAKYISATTSISTIQYKAVLCFKKVAKIQHFNSSVLYVTPTELLASGYNMSRSKHIIVSSRKFISYT